MPIGIKRLRYFLAVAEQGNINRAAEVLHISQSALTRSIQVLEDNLGAMLFDRTQRGVKLTAVGERLLEHAKRITNTVRTAELDLAHLVRGGDSEIRLGVNSSLPSTNIIDAVFRVLNAMPTLSVTIVDEFYDSLIQHLRLQHLDIALTVLPEGSDRSDLEVEVLYEQQRPMSVYARADHPLLRSDCITGEQITNARWVVSGEPHYQNMIDLYLLERSIPMPRFRLRCSSVTWMKRAILEEDFVALMSVNTVNKEFPPGSVVALPGTTVTARSQVGLVSSPSAVRPAAFTLLASEIRHFFRKQQEAQNTELMHAR